LCTSLILQALIFLSMLPPPPKSTLFPYTTLFRSAEACEFANESNSVLLSPFECKLLIFRAATATNQKVGSSNLSGRTILLLLLRSEEHTSELQSRFDLVCRLLLEKKNHSLNLICL